MQTQINASEVPRSIPEFSFGSNALQAFHLSLRYAGSKVGVQYVVNHGHFRTLNTTTSSHAGTVHMLDIIEGQ